MVKHKYQCVCVGFISKISGPYAGNMQLNYIGIALFYVLGRHTIKSLEFGDETHESVVLIKPQISI